ncbi:SAM-dependent methyltransferase [Pedobacter sp. KBW06]|uniref:class I SAM-dependent methyltransferase n=1 Tax=Pedobacter sp. KBW06 TaxID=2153359 RepID=UPI000F59BBE6|nr:class I SAM-dependent methyltransferase [Pedobacter sp. KBW06]RQO71686.1 SAM-dependent methyltransferase [Pedobacter sp. KBW06]
MIEISIQDFYTQSSEETRLQSGLGPFEFLRNKDLISRHLPKIQATIADIGGGTGHYASWLSALGHQVILVDPIEKHLQQAQKRAQKSKRSFRCIHGEARRLPIESNSVDVVILHGPLYHLQEQQERIAALKEAGRILRPGGIVIGFAITHAAFTLAALQNGIIHQPEVFNMCQQQLSSGNHHPPAEFPGMLAQAYFHKPAALSMEFEKAGFKSSGITAVEGIAWLDNNFFEAWAMPEKRERLLKLTQLIESDPDLLSLSPHIMIVAEIDYGL